MNMTCNALEKSDKFNIQNEKFDMTNLLRIIAVFFVFLCHGRSYVDGISDWQGKYSFLTVTPAWAGVWIFLFISGYGLGCGYWCGKYFPDNEFTLNRLCNFYKRRFFRIAPIYYLYCVLFEIFGGGAE